MNLSPEQREQVRLSLLRYGLASRGVSLGLMHSYLRSEGFSVEREQVELEVAYLADEERGLLREQPKAISPENKLWKTTAKGRDYLAELGSE